MSLQGGDVALVGKSFKLLILENSSFQSAAQWERTSPALSPSPRGTQCCLPRSAARGPHGVPIPTADSKWGPWNHWSLCSKTCDTGWQRRFRMCEGTGVQGYPCEGTGEEVKTCNEKKCPGTGQPPAPTQRPGLCLTPFLPHSLPRDVQG